MTGTEITKKASQFHNNYNALSINILPPSKISLSQSRYVGSWARIPGTMSPHTRAHEPPHRGRDKNPTIFTKGTKKNKLL